jgi:hypothetical protein
MGWLVSGQERTGRLLNTRIMVPGGERGIRTPDTRKGMPAFEAGAINHSAISPRPVGTSRQWYFIRRTDAGGSLNRFFSFFRQTKNAICDLIDHLDHFRAKRAHVGVEGHARVALAAGIHGLAQQQIA